ncbi:MAG TPA: lipase family protein, partial [Candidatus Acidoferrum sp.]|nr:lipase family protein [Candidatus Acidoferrum sp.]
MDIDIGAIANLVKNAADNGWQLVSDNKIVSILSLLGVGGTGWLARIGYQSRLSPEDNARPLDYPPIAPDLRQLPANRLGYSNRMAYIMAWLSNLAYYRFEGQNNFDPAALARDLVALSGNMTQQKALAFIGEAEKLLMTKDQNADGLAKILADNQFRLLQTFNKNDTQGFICRNTCAGQDPFVVVAFRGTEKEVKDWLTDADAAPVELNDGQLAHRGFHKAFNDVKDDIVACLEHELQQNPQLTVYYTGHSLGGALALMAGTLLYPETPGACYTYGAPRIGNYEFFFQCRNPCYRIVNSADVVPRVPPAKFVVMPIYWLLVLLKNLTNALPFVAGWLDKAA